MLVLLISAFNQTLVGTALPTMAGELGGAAELSWVVSGFILTATISMPIYGSLSDLFGRKALVIAAIVLFSAGSVVAALAGEMSHLIVGRLLQGLGGGGLMVLPPTILADVVPARQRAKLAGLFGAVWAVASVAGPLLGGWFTEGPGWRWAFWVNLPLGVAALVTIMLSLKHVRQPARHRRVDYFGMVTLAATTTGLVLLVTWAGTTFSWNSPELLITAGVTGVALILLVLGQRASRESVLPLRLFSNRTFALATIAGTLTSGAAMFVVVSYLPVYLQMVIGMSATEAGLMMIPMIGALLITSTIVGFVVSHTGRYKWIVVAGTGAVLIASLLLASMTPSTGLLVISLYTILFGAGLGAITQLLVLLVQNGVPATSMGSATAANNYFRQVGAAVGTAGAGSLLTAGLVGSLAGAGSDGPIASKDVIGSLTPAALEMLPEGVRELVISSYNEAFTSILLYLAPLPAISFVLLLMLKETSLSTTLGRGEAARGEARVEK